MPEVLQVYEPDHPRYRIRACADLVILATEGSPDVLERMVGLPADDKWSKGDLRRGGGGRPYTGLRYSSRLDEKRSPTDHAADLVARLRPHVDGIAAASRLPMTYGVALWVVEHTCAEDRQIDVQPEDLETIAAMGARLSLDLYFYGDATE